MHNEQNFFTTASIVSSDRILYTPSDFARAALIHLQEIGTLQALKPHVSSRSHLQSFLFFMVLRGSGSLSYEGKTHALRQGDCVFIDCDRPYAHTTSAGDLWALRWCHFFGASLPQVYTKYADRGGRPVFRPQDGRPFLDVLDKLYAAASGADHIRDMRINEELNALLTLLMAESWHPEDPCRSAVKRRSVDPIRSYLDSHYTETVTLDDLAGMFYINKYYLTRVFREQFGSTISAYLQSVRITHAKRLLRFSDMPVAEIAAACGLGAPYYFSRVFRAVEGVPPSVYRSRWRT